MTCKINRDPDTKQILSVEAPNGADSALYNDALAYTNGNQERALDFWAIAYTPEFQEQHGNWEESATLEEPSFDAVINYSLKENLKNNGLTKQDYFNLSNNTLGTTIKSLDGLYTAVRDAFIVNGTFSINERALRESKLYSEVEIENILSSTEVYKDVQKVVERLLSSYLNNTVNSKFRQTLATEAPDSTVLIQDTSQVVGIGKYKFMNPIEVEKTLNSTLAGITSREVFDIKVSEVPYSAFKVQYNSDPAFAADVYAKFSKKLPVRKFKETGNGLVESDVETAEIDRVSETLLVGVPNNAILANINFLRTIDEVSWNESIEDIEGILAQMEEDAIEMGLDIIGIKNIMDFAGQEEFLIFANQLENLTSKALVSGVTNDDIVAFVQSKNTLLEIANDSQYDYYNNTTDANALMTLNTVKSEANLFEENSLLKVEDGIYQKINRSESLESLINSVYLQVLKTPSLLPKEAYFPTAFNREGKLSISKLRDGRNEVSIKEDIELFLQNRATELDEFGYSLDTLKEISAYKYFFNYPQQVSESKEVAVDKMKAFNGDFGYLTTDFIAEFNQYVLTEKLNETEAYDSFLQYIEFSPLGLKLNVRPDVVRMNAEMLVPDGKLKTALKQYSILSRDKNLSRLFEVDHQNIDDAEANRLFYINNPAALKLFRSDYYVEDEVLVTQDGVNDFIKIKDNNGEDVLYEKVDEFAANSLYRQIPTNTEFEYNIVPNVTFEEVKQSVVNNIRRNMSPAVEDLGIDLASDAEINMLREEFDNCN